MEAISLPTLVQEHLTIARTASNGRSAHTVFGGHDHRLRQTLIALAAGQELAEHESPGEATIHVLAGAVQLTTTTDSALLAAGDVAVIPDERHRSSLDTGPPDSMERAATAASPTAWIDMTQGYPPRQTTSPMATDD